MPPCRIVSCLAVPVPVVCLENYSDKSDNRVPHSHAILLENVRCNQQDAANLDKSAQGTSCSRTHGLCSKVEACRYVHFFRLPVASAGLDALYSYPVVVGVVLILVLVVAVSYSIQYSPSIFNVDCDCFM